MKYLKLLFLIWFLALAGTVVSAQTGVTNMKAITSDITYYLCPAGQTTCVYNGDAGTSATPSDSNNCLTKGTPCATLAGVQAKIDNKIINAVVTVQYDSTAGTGTDCHLMGSQVLFNNPVTTVGQGDLITSEYPNPGLTLAYPKGYIWIRGDDTTSDNVDIVGATTCAGTASSTRAAVVSIGTPIRVSGVQLKYFKVGVQGVRTYIYLDKVNGVSDNPAPTVVDGAMLYGSQQTFLYVGGVSTVTNWNYVGAHNGSWINTRTPTATIDLAYSNAGGERVFFANEKSHILWGASTISLSGAGTYDAFSGLSHSSMNSSGEGGQITFTINAANATMIKARQGSYMSESCSSFQFSCTFTAMSKRANAEVNSTIDYGGTTAGTNPDTAATGSKITKNFGAGAFVTSIVNGFQDYLEISAPATPAANTGSLYVKDVTGVSGLFFKNDAGTETQLGSGGGGTPGGADTQIQRNNVGAFGAVTGCTSAGTNITCTSGNLIATKPRVVTSVDDTNGNEIFVVTATASAVNEVTVANAATGGNPTFTASGGDADVGIDWLVKGAGVYNYRASASGAADVRLFEDSDNGTNYNSIIANSSLASNVVSTLPSTTGTLANNPMTTGGDVIYGGASGVPTRLANGSANQVLTSAGGTSAPTWTTPTPPLFEWNMLTGSALTPDSSGNVFLEPYTNKATNDFFKYSVWTFNNPTADEILYGAFELPRGCASGAVFKMVYTSTAITGTLQYSMRYRVVTADDTNSLDQATAQETVTGSDTAPGATDRRMEVTITPTNSNFATAGTVAWVFTRVDASDTLAAAITLHGLRFSCQP